MSLLEQMSKTELRETIGKGWITHDGMWFAHSLMTHGIEETNRLNRAAIKSMAEIELRRFMETLDVSKDDLQTFSVFRDFFSNVREVMIPDFMNVTFRFEAPDTIHWQFTGKGCFAYNGVRRAGIQAQYECGPLYRVQCWLEILEIPYTMTPEITTCITPDKGHCKGSLTCRFRVAPDGRDMV